MFKHFFRYRRLCLLAHKKKHSLKLNGSWICFTAAIKCSDATIDSVWKMSDSFEPRYMMYRFVSQFVALQFFFYYVSLGLGICTSSWTQTWIYVCSWVLGHTCGSQRTICGGQFSPFYHRQQAAIPTESSYKPSSNFL